MKSISEVKRQALNKNQWLLEKRGDLLLVFSPLLKQYPNFVHAFTTRQGGQSKPPFHSFNIGINQTTDENARLDAYKNREILCRNLAIPFDKLKTSKKLVHSDLVVMLESVVQPEEVDGIVTKDILHPVFMTFADCVPIIIYDPIKHVLCLIHAGWRGTANSISAKAIQFMTDKCGCKPSDLLCAIGPAIGSCCYPVGLDAVEKLLYSLIEKKQLEEITKQVNKLKRDMSLENWSALNPEQLDFITNKFWSLIVEHDLKGFFVLGPKQIHVDLKAINASQLLNAGLQKLDITDLCTACAEDLFYSYRRSFVNQQGPTGRQAAIACLL